MKDLTFNAHYAPKYLYDDIYSPYDRPDVPWETEERGDRNRSVRTMEVYDYDSHVKMGLKVNKTDV